MFLPKEHRGVRKVKKNNKISERGETQLHQKKKVPIKKNSYCIVYEQGVESYMAGGTVPPPRGTLGTFPVPSRYLGGIVIFTVPKEDIPLFLPLLLFCLCGLFFATPKEISRRTFKNAFRCKSKKQNSSFLPPCFLFSILKKGRFFPLSETLLMPFFCLF